MNPFVELISIIIGIYVNIVILRFFLQYFRADFYNPLSQFVVKATDPLIKPLRKVVPSVAGLDTSSILLAWLITVFKIIFIQLIAGVNLSGNILTILLISFLDVITGAISLFIFLIIVRVILSWVAPTGHNPIFSVIGQLTEPFLSKFRQLIPPAGGFDFSSMIALIFLWFTNRLITFYLYPLVSQI